MAAGGWGGLVGGAVGVWGFLKMAAGGSDGLMGEAGEARFEYERGCRGTFTLLGEETRFFDSS